MLTGNSISVRLCPAIESFRGKAVDGSPPDFAVSEPPNPKGADKLSLPGRAFRRPSRARRRRCHSAYQPQAAASSLPSTGVQEMAPYYIFQTGSRLGWDRSGQSAELILNLLLYSGLGAVIAGCRHRASCLCRPMSWARVSACVRLPKLCWRELRRTGRWKDFEPGSEDDFAVWLPRSPVNGRSWKPLRGGAG